MGNGENMDLLIPVFSGALGFLLTFMITPRIIDKMYSKGFVGNDVNKKERPPVAEMGGIAAVFGFVMGITVALGIGKLMGTMDATVVLSIISVMLIAAFIGILDDIVQLSHKQKSVFVAFAAIPLVLTHPGWPSIPLPFGHVIEFPMYVYWLIVVPFAITGAANALNMSAGYNGLETGQIAVISGFLSVIGIIKNVGNPSLMVFFALTGTSLALYYYNRYPARTFVGDVGTLSMGAVIGAGTIISGLQVYGLILIAPAFFEFFSTIYHNRKGVNRREACMNPIIGDDGKLSPPPGSRWYTLPYFLLTSRPMTERALVRTMLGIYAIFGFLAMALSVL